MVSHQPFFQQPNNAPDSTVILQRHSYMFQLEGTLRNTDHAQSHYVFVTSYSSTQCIAYFCSLGCATSRAPYLKAWFPCLLFFFRQDLFVLFGPTGTMRYFFAAPYVGLRSSFSRGRLIVTFFRVGTGFRSVPVMIFACHYLHV